ncbi:uncharacterized protein [Nicotiana tomentosiformis]|uniref:uncharacterized protein n=1 Tax=Nicotiana tomentosiformis TaxID=4098 RepID=UPI00388C7785
MQTGSLIQMKQNPLSGYVFSLGGGAISWKSTKQMIIARSTMESEFVALEIASSEVDWLRNFLANIPLIKDFIRPVGVLTVLRHYSTEIQYIKHLASKMAHRGWNVVVINYRGLGGVSITERCYDTSTLKLLVDQQCFIAFFPDPIDLWGYTGRWIEDAGKVIDHLHTQYPQAPLFVVGTSVGANALVIYLCGEGVNPAIVGAAAICNPWDILGIEEVNPDGSFNLLEWWKDKEKYFPILSRMARDILTIQASTVTSESAFTQARLQLGDYRASMRESLEKSVLFRDWIRSERRNFGLAESQPNEDEAYEEMLAELAEDVASPGSGDDQATFPPPPTEISPDLDRFMKFVRDTM